MLSTLPSWILTPWVSMPLGVVLLWWGAEALVHGASKIAASLGISHVVIGLTLVAFGTSLPELVICVMASLQGTPNFAVGNIVGSNICNIGLIAGVAALICPLAVAPTLMRRDIPWAMAAALAVGVFALTGSIGRTAGIILITAFVCYMLRLYRSEVRQTSPEEESEEKLSRGKLFSELGIAIVGLLMVFFGAPLLLEGATGVARSMGISELVIGLTLIAIGTSLPELATVLVAARRGKADIVLGNVIGSNIFNVFLVIATTSMLSPLPIERIALVQDIPVMIGFSLLLAVIAMKTRRLSRGTGVMLLTLYLGYTVWLFLR